MSEKMVEIRNEEAKNIVMACGNVGVLSIVDNDELSDNHDVQLRHKKASDKAKKYGNSPEAQAIYARIFGLI
jgi:hypothetical protein